ncbi:HD domain-containing phosphohydrolase [uncultured Eubacterium sp.]|uniref:HD domain-containing phosphohydrolase n=1 Tax=uncultured Eubacterium sp. TaxID=165185 RepID=UPI0025E89755|nr:HD domain-containing phosphohydrolase [uncultured Eubacterium sp.]
MNEKQTILIVDDSKFNRDILKEILGETYHYLEAENGNQAIQLIGDNPGIDLMLLDIHMPQTDGFEVLELMNESQCINETPVIMISSEESVTMMRKAYEMGITDYITRPFDSVIVKKRVQNTLDLYVTQKRLINVVVDQVYEKEENNNIMIRILSNVLGSRNSESCEHILHIRTATELMLRKLIKISDAYHLTEADIALITTASSLHDIGKIRIPEEILNKPGKLSDEEFKIMKTHSELGASIIQDMSFTQNHPLVHTAWEICRWHHERWDGRGYPDGLKGEEIPISAQVVSIVDVYDALTSERCYKKAFDHDTAMNMILDGQCGQFNPILLKCLKELSLPFSKMLSTEMDDNKYYHEVQSLSNEILSDKFLPNRNYSQCVIKILQEKVDFFKTNSGMNSIDYNAMSGQLMILNGKQQILCQRNDPKFALFREFEVSEEDVQQIQVLLHQTSVQNKEFSVQIKAKVENKRQMCKLKLHTLWSPLKKDEYIGIIGYFDTIKVSDNKE